MLPPKTTYCWTCDQLQPMLFTEREVKPLPFRKPWTKETPEQHAPWRTVFMLGCGHQKDLICTKSMITRVNEGIYR